MAPINKKKQIKLITIKSNPKKLKFKFKKYDTNEKTIVYFNVPKIINIIEIPNNKDKSPIRLINIAFIAALFAKILVYQKLINK